jgi:hypothetical protein
VLEQELPEKLSRALGVVVKHHEVVEGEVGSHIGTEFDPQVVSTIADQLKDRPLLNCRDLDGDPLHAE